jgi:hypothetical protein
MGHRHKNRILTKLNHPPKPTTKILATTKQSILKRNTSNYINKQDRKLNLKKPGRALILLVLFIILSLIAIATVYAVHQTPYIQNKTTTLCTYTSTVTYDYTATLEPSTIYQNKTILKSNEGVLYIRLTKEINPTLTYTFSTSVPTTTTTINYDITQTLKTTVWEHQITQTPKTTTDQKQIQITLPTISKAELDIIKAQIDAEAGSTTSKYYSVDITPKFTITANIQAGTIHQTFQPTLTISFERAEEGDIITIEDLQQTETGTLTVDQAVWRQDLLNQRYASYILIAVSIIGLTSSLVYYKKQPPTPPKPKIEKLIQTHKDLIVETIENTDPRVLQHTTITVTTLKELAKTAEILVKPILHTTKNQTHIFYVIDNNTKYQYEEPQPQEPKQTTTPKENQQP